MVLFVHGLILVLVFSAAYGQQNKFKLKPGAQGKLCLECHDAFKEKLKNPFVHTPVKTGECTECHDPHSSSTENYWTKIQTKYAVSATKELYPKIPKAAIK